jgi:hypothetical protein
LDLNTAFSPIYQNVTHSCYKIKANPEGVMERSQATGILNPYLVEIAFLGDP